MVELRAVAYGLSFKSKLKIPLLAEFETSFNPKDKIDREQNLTRDPFLDRSLYYEAFDRLADVQLDKGKQIVVLIDDLDRCFPNVAIQLLESMKLVFSQRGFIFVLGVARKVIEGYLQHRYEDDYGITDFDGQLYLDKIVQLPFHIPPHKSRMEEFSDRLLADLSSKDKHELQDIVRLIAISSGSNPRATVRFVNNLLIDRAIAEQIGSMMKNVPIRYFAVSRILQTRWPKALKMLASDDELCLWLSRQDESLKDWMVHDVDGAKILFDVMKSEPQLLEILLLTDSGRDWLEDSKNRKASVEFLARDRNVESVEVGIFFDDEIDGEKHDRLLDLLEYWLDRWGVTADECYYSVEEASSLLTRPRAESSQRDAVFIVLPGIARLKSWREHIIAQMRFGIPVYLIVLNADDVTRHDVASKLSVSSNKGFHFHYPTEIFLASDEQELLALFERNFPTKGQFRRSQTIARRKATSGFE